MDLILRKREEKLKQSILSLVDLKASKRLENHLSYKLGKAMIENSKSLLGLLKLPFVIFCTVSAHKRKNK